MMFKGQCYTGGFDGLGHMSHVYFGLTSMRFVEEYSSRW